MKVLKRDGTSQQLDLDKIHAVLDWACNGKKGETLQKIKGVSVSEIEMRAQLLLHNHISTKQIHETLINATVGLISEDTPNYDHVAARLRWFSARKEAFGENVPPHLLKVIKLNIRRGIYDPELLKLYSEKDWGIIDSFIVHDRDDLFRSAGAEQMYKKYLAQNRKTKQIYESFQFPYILVAAILFAKYPKDTRLGYVKRYYDAISQHYISLPTPIMSGLRTKVKQFSSCVLISSGDSLKSINATAAAIVDYASRKAGIGLDIGRIRALGQSVRGGDAVTTGMVPFIKYFAAALKSCSQGAVRGASATLNYPIWHLEFERLIELKNNKGVEETRVRVVDYCVHLNKTMYERLVAKSHITFFSPEEVPDLYEAFYSSNEEFKELYEKYEQDNTKTKHTLPAIEVFSKLMSERFDTGRIYILHADLVNERSPFYEPITMSNLCTEIAIPTKPMGDENSEIALCTLSAANWGKIETEEQMEEYCSLAVRALDELLDYQDYPNEAAIRNTTAYRPLGVGIIGFSHFLAKLYLGWGTESTIKVVESKMESMAYYLTKTSIDLAEEKGACPRKTKYHEGIFPCDLSGAKTTKNWNVLREKAKKFGIRNAVLSALMPSETSSQLANETNGIEPPRELISIKASKDGVMTQVVPEFGRLSHVYETAWNIPVQEYLKTIAPLQKYVDQAISANTTYNPENYPDQRITSSILIKDLILAYKLGFKTLYYNNTYDGAGNDVTTEEGGCAGGACKI
jgi:ribonucleoside-diphosphate reductase alpha chain